MLVSHMSGSIYLIICYQNNYSLYDGIVTGYQTRATVYTPTSVAAEKGAPTMKGFKIGFISVAIWIMAICGGCDGSNNGIVPTVNNISVVPLWDGEVVDPSGMLMNRFGGNPVNGIATTVTHITDVVKSGAGAFRIDTNGQVNRGDFDFFATSLTGFASVQCDPSSPVVNYIDTRDITGFNEIQFSLKNETGAPFTLVLEIKDYRDSNDHRARKSFNITAWSGWADYSVPLDTLDSKTGWEVIGEPDLSRTKLFAFVIEANQGVPVGGSIFVDDMVLIEKGGALDALKAPINDIVERLAFRQFRGLWGSRDRGTGLVPSISSFADVSSLNTTGALIRLLPAAIEQGWVSNSESNLYVSRVVETINTLMDGVIATGNGGFVPPRYIDRVCLVPDFVLEESSVDAAFIFLALYGYKSRVDVDSTLRTQIESLLARFNFKAFANPSGWKLAYLYDTGAFTPSTYDGYSGEVWLISLAAHLQTNLEYRVDIEELYHSGIRRVKTFLVDPTRTHVVHEFPEFRAPFLQWLQHLFVNVSERGLDTYPIPELATNPYYNAIQYQRECQAYLSMLGREKYLQPDAGDDGTGMVYEQFSCYQDFGQPALFMPWSAAFVLLADPEGGGDALRHHLQNGLHGPLGLSDSAVWETSAPQASRIPARHDFWNLSLSTMALMQYRFRINQSLTELPAVQEALDRVFQ